MKAISRLPMLALMLPLIVFTSCESDNWYMIRGSGPVMSESRIVPVHRNLNVSVPAEVHIYQSLVRDLTIEAQANVLDAIDTYVDGNELNIKLADGMSLGTHEPIVIYISSAMYNTIRLSGSVDLIAETPIVTDVFDVTVSGSGSVDAEVDANTVVASISGSARMWLQGNTLTQQYTVSGSGYIYSYDLYTETSDISISGSGRIEVNVAEYLKARISGSGDIYYAGYPTVNSQISGSGRLFHVE